METKRLLYNWDSAAKGFIVKSNESDWFFTKRLRLMSQLIHNVVPCCDVLDVGCGPGILISELLDLGYNCFGCDVSAQMIEAAVKLNASKIKDNATHFKVSEDGKIPYDRKFSLVTAIGVFSYVPIYSEFVVELKDHLNENGYILATSLNRISFYAQSSAIYSLIRGNCREAINLVRTGLWSGGGVDYRSSKQCYSAACFDRLFFKNGFRKVTDLSLFGPEFERMDKSPFKRNWPIRSIARHFGWSYIGLYKKSNK